MSTYHVTYKLRGWPVRTEPAEADSPEEAEKAILRPLRVKYGHDAVDHVQTMTDERHRARVEFARDQILRADAEEGLSQS